MKFSEIGDPQYIALETFKKSGEGVITPVWAVRVDDKLTVWTGADSWKVKRIRNNPNVRLAVSDSRGNPKSEWVEAKAAVIDSPAAEAEQRTRIAKKYRIVYRLIMLTNWLRRDDAPHVVVELEARKETELEARKETELEARKETELEARKKQSWKLAKKQSWKLAKKMDKPALFHASDFLPCAGAV